MLMYSRLLDEFQQTSCANRQNFSLEQLPDDNAGWNMSFYTHVHSIITSFRNDYDSLDVMMDDALNDVNDLERM